MLAPLLELVFITVVHDNFKMVHTIYIKIYIFTVLKITSRTAKIFLVKS
jgi:hypothetical protein